jgi:hypothetical protein
MDYLFSTLYVGQLPISDLYSLGKSTIGYAIPVRGQLGVVPDAALGKLETANAAMGEQMNRQRKNELTPEVANAEKNRIGCYSEIKRTVTTALRSRKPAKKEAGQKMKYFLEPYWYAHKKSMNTQTGIFSEMYDKYQDNSTLQAYAATAGVDNIMDELNSLNLDFDELYKTRNTEETTEGPSASTLKAAVVKSYDNFCINIEQAMEFAPSPAITLLFNQMDGLRKTYARQVNPKGDQPNGDKTNPEPEE